MSFGNRLKQAREKKKLYQHNLADSLNITDGTISNYEKGIAFPRWDKIIKLCDILDVDPNYLFWDDISEKLKNKIAREKDNAPNTLYETLNETGKAKADEYIEDLADNPKYTQPLKNNDTEFASDMFESIADDITNMIKKGNVNIK